MDLHSPSSSPANGMSGHAFDMSRGLPLGDLLALGAQLSAEITPEALLQEVAESIHAVLGYAQVCIRVRNSDTDALEACAASGIEQEQLVQIQENHTAPAYYQTLLQQQYRISNSYLVPNRNSMLGAPASPEESIEGGVLLTPLRGRGDRLVGVIYVVPAEVNLETIQLLELIARQAALALENARLAARSARLLAKEQLLAELGRDISSTLDLETILSRTVDRMKVAFHGGAIALLNDGDELEILATIGNIDDEARQVRLKVGEGICGWVMRSGMPFLSNDTLHETRVVPAARDVGTNRLIRSFVAVPLRSGGKVIGTLSVESDEINAFTYEDVDLLEAVAAQIGGPIASSRLYQQTQRLAEEVKRRNEQLTVLNTLARMAVGTLDVQRMLRIITAEIQRSFGFGHVELYLVDEEDDELVIAAHAGEAHPVQLGERRPITQGLLGRAYREGSTIRVDDVQCDPDYVMYNMPKARSELCVPISISNRVIGMLNLESRRVAAFTDEDIAVLETAADVLAGGIENARLYQRAQEGAVMEERSRLARDLHDSISQQLFSMTLTAQAARAQLEKNPARTATQLERLQETAAAALGEMRALIFQLRPPALSEQGLVGALKQHVTALGRREGLSVTLDVHGDEKYARGAEQAIYRIAQEALNNVVRHAGACNVAVDLSLSPENIRLRVVDDGSGFDPATAATTQGRHLGLTSMRERATELGGTFDIQSTPNQGTEIVVTVPGREEWMMPHPRQQKG